MNRERSDDPLASSLPKAVRYSLSVSEEARVETKVKFSPKILICAAMRADHTDTRLSLRHDADIRGGWNRRMLSMRSPVPQSAAIPASKGTLDFDCNLFSM